VDEALDGPRDALSSTEVEPDDVVGHLMAVLPNALRLTMLTGLSADEAADAVQDATIQAWRRHRQTR
jgi:DNA-directed RNA polymerase specialized sigma24 family protein